MQGSCSPDFSISSKFFLTMLFLTQCFFTKLFFQGTFEVVAQSRVQCNISNANYSFICDPHAYEKKRGCVVFTSSAAACQPTPFSALYGATKAYLSSFAASIAVELKSRGIDVCAIHPSPVMSNFYDRAHKLDSLAFFMRFAVKPDVLPDEIFRSIGRVIWHDIGLVAVGFRLLLKFFDYNFLATLTCYFAHTMDDYKKNM